MTETDTIETPLKLAAPPAPPDRDDLLLHWWTVDDVAAYLGYHPQYVRDLARAGILPGRKRRRIWVFLREEIETFVEKQTRRYREAQRDTIAAGKPNCHAHKAIGIDPLPIDNN